MVTKLCIADQNKLFCEGLSALLGSSRDYETVFIVQSGEKLLDALKKLTNKPEICLINPELEIPDKGNALKILTRLYPEIKSIALSETNSASGLYQLLEYGAKAHISRLDGIDRLRHVLEQVKKNGYYYDNYMNEAIAAHFEHGEGYELDSNAPQPLFTRRQEEFILLCCSDMPFKEIASKMGISTRTADKMREIICSRLKVKTRIGIVMYAVDHGIYLVKQ